MWRLKFQRWLRQRKGGLDPGLAAYWNAPLPATRQPWQSARFLVCDGEMSGLDPSDAELLSLGWIAIDEGEISLASAEHRLIRNTASVGPSAAIHQLRDCELAEGESAREVLLALLEAAAGRVLVFHHAPIDMAFLNIACQREFGASLLPPIADTLSIEQALLARANQAPASGALRLQACRDRYGLQGHHAHNALTDAVATAELFLAQLARRGDGVLLKDVLSPQ